MNNISLDSMVSLAKTYVHTTTKNANTGWDASSLT